MDTGNARMMNGVRARDADPLMRCIFVQYVSCGFASAPPHPFALPLLKPFPHSQYSRIYPLDCAVRNGDFEMVRFLVGAGADVNAVDW